MRFANVYTTHGIQFVGVHLTTREAAENLAASIPHVKRVALLVIREKAPK